MTEEKVLIGKRFGRLEVIEYYGKNHRKRKEWLCQCDCGNKKIITQDCLNSGRVNSCGCLRKEKTTKLHSRDLTGMKFGEWTVLEKIGSNKNQKIEWKCRCSCGNAGVITTSQLISGKSKCCKDCAYKIVGNKNRKHGMSEDRIYKIYTGMKIRCYDENIEHFDKYGGRGIKICDEWLGDKGFENFYKWAMANGYKEGLTIDRINVNGNYEPSNCRWVAKKEQANNRRTNVFITVDGVKMTTAQAAEKYGVKYETLRSRIKSGYSPDIAVRKGLWERGNKCQGEP